MKNDIKRLVKNVIGLCGMYAIFMVVMIVVSVLIIVSCPDFARGVVSVIVLGLDVCCAFTILSSFRDDINEQLYWTYKKIDLSMELEVI